eukprot:CAMPEP_0181416040 /NCGR_PEP_ID=MMETSP1110-20121109/10321_1 /TAXON_ID=174948 /ORGANISM="Symbiodinium sp., Strain CCMP421" /LENGTH=112 /DNA_ID=CAMNT_0023538949 /DNA_START=173 /DNA_END=512 /DNA_ORIENTATION=-
MSSSSAFNASLWITSSCWALLLRLVLTALSAPAPWVRLVSRLPKAACEAHQDPVGKGLSPCGGGSVMPRGDAELTHRIAQLLPQLGFAARDGMLQLPEAVLDLLSRRQLCHL